MFPPPKKYTPLSRKPTDIDRAELYKDLKEYGRFTGLCWLLSPEPPPVSAGLPIPTIEEIIFSEEFLKTRGLQEQLDCLVRRCRISSEDIVKISDLTVGQRDNSCCVSKANWLFSVMGSREIGKASFRSPLRIIYSLPVTTRMLTKLA